MAVPSILGRARNRLTRAPSLEIHVPISPTAVFLNMVRCLALSLRRFGGAYRDVPVIVTAGAERIDHTLADRNPWLADLGVELRWAPEDLFRDHSYMAQGLMRLRYPYRSEMVLLFDADLLIAGPFDDAVRAAHRDGAVAGMIGPASPLQFYPQPTTWDDLYRHCGLKKRPDVRYEHTGWPYYCSPDPAYRHCPPYFNYGVVCAPADVLPRVESQYLTFLQALRSLHPIDLNAQVAFGMAVDGLGVPVHALPVRYNFPNHPMMEALHGRELPDARILHLKENHQSHKHEVFASAENIRAHARRTDLRGVNALAQKVLAEIEGGLERNGPTVGAT